MIFCILMLADNIFIYINKSDIDVHLFSSICWQFLWYSFMWWGSILVDAVSQCRRIHQNYGLLKLNHQGSRTFLQKSTFFSSAIKKYLKKLLRKLQESNFKKMKIKSHICWIYKETVLLNSNGSCLLQTTKIKKF